MENNHGIIIDPCEHELLEKTLKRGIILDKIILTHEHADHIYGVNWIKSKYSVSVECSKKCAINIEDDKKNHSRYYNNMRSLSGTLMSGDSATMDPFVCKADVILDDNMLEVWNGHSILCKYTPGHSEGSVCFMIDDKLLFSGDTIFRNFPTVTRFKGGSADEFRNISLPWISGLDNDVEVYPGHFLPFKLSEWKYRE